ncbi:hypothetical protein EMMF5_004653 [Cystobasidiomycetes sp. EMM_F5]
MPGDIAQAVCHERNGKLYFTHPGTKSVYSLCGDVSQSSSLVDGTGMPTLKELVGTAGYHRVTISEYGGGGTTSGYYARLGPNTVRPPGWAAKGSGQGSSGPGSGGQPVFRARWDASAIKNWAADSASGLASRKPAQIIAGQRRPGRRRPRGGK